MNPLEATDEELKAYYKKPTLLGIVIVLIAIAVSLIGHHYDVFHTLVESDTWRYVFFYWPQVVTFAIGQGMLLSYPAMLLFRRSPIAYRYFAHSKWMKYIIIIAMTVQVIMVTAIGADPKIRTIEVVIALPIIQILMKHYMTRMEASNDEDRLKWVPDEI